MPIALTCDCGRALRVKDELAGKKIRCPECKSTLTVPGKDAEEVVELEVVSAEEDEPSSRKSTRRAAIQSERPEPPSRRPALEEDEPPPRRRAKPARDLRRRAPSVTFERGWFGDINAGVAGGILMMLIAVIWFVVGLAGGIIFFYPPILFVIGIVAIIKGGFGGE